MSNGKTISVLVVGQSYSAYRAAYILKSLSGYPANETICISATNANYFRGKKIDRSTALSKLWGSTVFFLSQVVLLVELLLKIPFADVVLVLPMNPVQFFPAAGIAKLWRRPVIVDLYASLYTTACDRKQVPSDGTGQLSRLLKFADRMVFELSTKVIHHTFAEVEQIAEAISLDKSLLSRVEVAPLVVDQREVLSIGGENNKSKEHIDIAWWGTFVPLQGLERVLEATAILKDRGVSVNLSIFGVEKGYENFERKIKALNIEGEVSLRKDATFSNGKIVDALQLGCDLVLGIFGTSEKADVVIPNKVVDAMSMRLPVLTRSSIAVDEFYEPGKHLHVCSSEPSSIASEIERIKGDLSGNALVAREGHQRFKELNTDEAFARNLCRIVNELAALKTA